MAYSRTRVREKYRPKAEKLVDQVREVMRFHHYAYRTEQTYVDWIVRVVKFHGIWQLRELELLNLRELELLNTETYLFHLAQANCATLNVTEVNIISDLSLFDPIRSVKSINRVVFLSPTGC